MLVATRNRHKLGELAALLAWPRERLHSLAEYPDLPPVEEDGGTFAANAAKKARAAADATGLPALADDSGLEVDALGGAPGVYSARYAGAAADDAANNRKLLDALRGVADRRARFRCVVALTAPRGAPRLFEGVCEGVLLTAPRGAGGFGYDPLFMPDGRPQTFAELEPSVKNEISHRARALALLRAAWERGDWL